MSEVLWFAVICGGVALIYGIFTARSVISADPGSEKMQEISNAVVYEAAAGVETVSINRVNTTTTRTLILTFISKSTGAYKHFNLSLPKYPIDQ